VIFHRANINAIFNLTEPGEHPHCGDGILDSGFSYTPELFMHQKGGHQGDFRPLLLIFHKYLSLTLVGKT
jgi:hypothetical protein